MKYMISTSIKLLQLSYDNTWIQSFEAYNKYSLCEQ